MEMSGGIGAAGGPLLGSMLNGFFGYKGPFLVFSGLYIIMFCFVVKNVPSDNLIESKLQVDQEEYLIPYKRYKYSLGTRHFYRQNMLFATDSIGYSDNLWIHDVKQKSGNLLDTPSAAENEADGFMPLPKISEKSDSNYNWS